MKTKYSEWTRLRSSFKQINYIKTVWRQLWEFECESTIRWHLESIVNFSWVIIILWTC